MVKKNKAPHKNSLLMVSVITVSLIFSTILVLGQSQNRQEYIGRAQVPDPNCLGSCPTEPPMQQASGGISCVNDVCITSAPGQPNILDCQNGVCRDGSGNIIGGGQPGQPAPGQPAQPDPGNVGQPGVTPGSTQPGINPNPGGVNPPAGGPPQNISIICQNGVCKDGNGNPVSNPFDSGSQPGQPIQDPTGGINPFSQFMALISGFFGQLFGGNQP